MVYSPKPRQAKGPRPKLSKSVRPRRGPTACPGPLQADHRRRWPADHKRRPASLVHLIPEGVKLRAEVYGVPDNDSPGKLQLPCKMIVATSSRDPLRGRGEEGRGGW